MKKFLGILMAAAMVTSFSVATMASDTGMSVEPRYRVCENCDTGKIVQSTEYGRWKDIIIRKCQHGYSHGTDVIQERTVITVLSCDNCGFETEYFEEVQERPHCNGYDRFSYEK